MAYTTHNVSTAGFIADVSSITRNSGRQIDWANVGEEYRETPGNAAVLVVVGAAGAIATATSVPVDALSGPIPSGTILDFEGAGKFAILTADAAAGATSLTVEALPDALDDDDEATYAGSAGSGQKHLRAGTVIGELLGSGKISPRVVTTNPATGILETDAVENNPVAALSGYGVIIGGVIYEALLPDATGTPRQLPAAFKTELDAAETTGFAWMVYSDAR
jgi:hypothetical protein